MDYYSLTIQQKREFDYDIKELYKSNPGFFRFCLEQILKQNQIEIKGDVSHTVHPDGSIVNHKIIKE